VRDILLRELSLTPLGLKRRLYMQSAHSESVRLSFVVVPP
jgi:hypothetical protein